MFLKLTAVAQKSGMPVNRLWLGLVAFLRARRQQARDRRAISRMNDHMLRDIGLTQSVYSPRDRAR